MTVLLSDPRVRAIEVRESGEPLVRLPETLSSPQCWVRAGVASRLVLAQQALGPSLRLHVVEGHRSPVDQQRIIERYSAEVRTAHPGTDGAELERLVSRFVAPLDVAGHVSGSAVDLTLTDPDGVELDLGTAIDATPEVSGGLCFTEAPGLPEEARRLRQLMGAALSGAGLVNYPTEWWHWSWGDRYWAWTTSAAAALHLPVDVDRSTDATGAAA
jgi:zinc D-Ala-D-Ala dipeptidase